MTDSQAIVVRGVFPWPFRRLHRPIPRSCRAAGNGAIPPLENGDRLTREEFERRYDAMPNLKNAELIDGVVYLRLRTRHRQHAAPHARLAGWLGYYAAFTPGVEAGNSSQVRLDGRDMPQPDVLLLIQPEHGGQARIDEDDYIPAQTT